MSVDRITSDDYARLHYSYHEDTDLEIVADTLTEEHGMGWLVFLYWPRIIAKAKQAKTFGWFSATPRALATSVHDPIASGGLWAARARMWDLLAGADLIRVRQGAIENPSTKVDVLLVEYEKWQSFSQRERTKLSRERTRVREGKEPHWTVRHLAEFAFLPIGSSSAVDLDHSGANRYEVTNQGVAVTENRVAVTENRVAVTPLDETRQDETKEGARDRALPPTVIETMDLVRQIPGVSRFNLESNVRKAMLQYPSLSDEAICEAITAFEAQIPEGQPIHPGKAWNLLLACFRVAGPKAEEAATNPTRSRFSPSPAPGTPEWNQRVIESLGTPGAA